MLVIDASTRASVFTGGAVQEQVQRMGPNGSVLVPVDFALKQQYSRAERLLELQTQAHCTTAFARTCPNSRSVMRTMDITDETRHV